MKTSDRWLAVIAYLLPIVGWLYLWFSQRKNAFVMFHLRQSVGICLGTVLSFLVWAVVGWVLAWIPYVFVLSIMLYAMVVLVVVLALIAWFVGVINALRLNRAYVPIFGRWANRLPI